MSPENYALDPEALKAFCAKWKITRLAVFGSMVRGEAKPGSDLDVLVDFAPDAPWTLFDHMDMEEELEVLAGRKVDLVSRKGLMRSQNWMRRESILAEQEPVYVA